MIARTEYAGWPNCYRLTKGDFELIVTTDVGPRVIRCGFVGGQNLFKEFADQLGQSGEPTWQPRGGHRLWLAPESIELSYGLDNQPIQALVEGESIILNQHVEPETGFRKQIIIHLLDNGAEVVHRLQNTNEKPRTIAPWALTMMAPGGTAVAAFPPRGTHPQALQPTNPLVMWGYTNFADARWRLTEKYLILRQDPHATTPVKAGLWNRQTWQAYYLGTQLFVKSTTATKGPEAYPDMGCSLETFTNAEFLEMETLGPLVTVQPNEVIAHNETWRLFRNIRIHNWTDDELDRVIALLAT
jgi:hypothetical protein